MNLKFCLLTAFLFAACAQVRPDVQEQSQPLTVVAAPLASNVDAVELAKTHPIPSMKPAELDGLHNVFHLGDHIISGSEPHGNVALDELAAMGVKTILSVDGKAPEWEAAAARGMRYVHIPIQYDGMEPDQLDHIAKAFRELPGPFYVHCFHGKHRGPAAAAIGRMVLDGIPREEALAEMMQWCGTAATYKGLFQEIAFANVPTAAETAREVYDFPSHQTFDGLRAAMIPMPRHFDELKAAQKRGWEVDPSHPDIVPAREALQLSQIFAHCVDMQDYDHDMPHSEEVLGWFKAGQEGTTELARVLGSQSTLEAAGTDWRAQAESAYKLAASSCKDCHAKYRD